MASRNAKTDSGNYDSTSHHGYGTGIVAEIVQKYSGMVEYFESGGMFGVQIMLPEE